MRTLTRTPMSKWTGSVAVAGALVALAFAGTTAFAQADSRTKGWQLPFAGQMKITLGPNEGATHRTYLNNTQGGFYLGSAEAIDYGPLQANVPARSPSDGFVYEVLTDPCGPTCGYGKTVRIEHHDAGGQLTGVVSFFAHLDSTSVVSGTFVHQGQEVGIIGCTGGASQPLCGVHLHFEARTGYVRGDLYQGQSIPIREIPGNWWNPQYAPPPDSRSLACCPSGAAQYPESVNPPPIATPGARHLSNTTSPQSSEDPGARGEPAAHTSNITDTQTVIHGGGSPSTPPTQHNNNSTYWETWLQTEQWIGSQARWEAPYLSYRPDPTWTQAYDSSNTCFSSNGQRCHRVWSRYHGRAGQAWSVLPTYAYLHTGVSGTGQPAIAASFDEGDPFVTLEFGRPGGERYVVWEWHGGTGTERQIYDGKASRIRAYRELGPGGDNEYIVRVQYADQTWSPWSVWLFVSDF